MLSAVHRTLPRMCAALRPGNLDHDLDSELEAHITLLTEDYIRRGSPAGEADRLARIALGAATQLREAHRDIRALPFVDTLFQDLRYTFRTLRNNAGFTVFAVLIIGLWIGACSTIFSAVDALLIRPLPFNDPTRLVWIYNLADDRVSEWSTQVDHFLDLREQNRSSADLAAYFPFFEPGNAKVSEGGMAERFSSLQVSHNFFPFLGVPPLVGRTFTADECRWNAPGAAIVSYDLWKRRYASDPNIVGRSMTLNDRSVTIVGVAPESFEFGSVFAPGNRIDVYLPMPLTPETNRWGNTLAVIGRLKPGVMIQGARAEFQALADRIQEQHPERNTLRPILMSLDDHVTGRLRRAFLVLAWAVGVVMLIVCATVANLQLARGAARQKEMAIRVAIGAWRRRLIRQVLTESVALSCCGSLLGVFLAMAGTRLLAGLNTLTLPLLSTVRMDATSLAFSLLVAVVTGLLFGLAPALQVPFASIHDSLKDSGRSSIGTNRHVWIRSTLVVSEIVFACVLLVGAGLLSRSFLNLLSVDLGFQPERAAALRVDPGRDFSSLAERDTYYNQIIHGVRSLPGIGGAGLTDVLPLAGDRSRDVTAKGKTYPRGQYPESFIRVISDGYLQALGIPLRAGRGFTEQDTPSSEPVALVNETLARTLWPGQNPIGQIVIGEGSGNAGRRVVGVVVDVALRAS